MNNKTLVRERPTPGEMEIIEQIKGMMFSFIYKPDSIVDSSTSKAFLEGWLTGLGLKASPRLVLVLVPPGLDMESFKQRYFEELDKSVNSSWPLTRKIGGLVDVE